MGRRNEQVANRHSRQAGAVVAYVQAANPRHENEPTVNTSADNECDANADTCCLGPNFVVLHHTFRRADMYAYDSSIKPIENIPIITRATDYDNPVTRDAFILVVHISLYYGKKLDRSLINPNQVRSYGIPFWDNPFDAAHLLSIEVDNDLTIPMRNSGTKVIFRSRVPTPQELTSCPHISMTSPTLWNPTDVVFAQQTDRGGNTNEWKRHISCTCGVSRSEYIDASSDDALLNEIDPSIVRLGERLHKPRRIAQANSEAFVHSETPARRTFVSNERHSKISAELIAERFGIGPIRAQKTLRVTAQRGVRSAILPISRRYRADRVFGVKRLNGKFATDTANGKLKSLHGNVRCQLYSHKCGFKAAYPIQRVDGNHVGDTLTQFINNFCAPEHLTFDGAAFQTGPKTRFMSAIRRYEILPDRDDPNENPAERVYTR